MCGRAHRVVAGFFLPDRAGCRALAVQCSDDLEGQEPSAKGLSGDIPKNTKYLVEEVTRAVLHTCACRDSSSVRS